MIITITVVKISANPRQKAPIIIITIIIAACVSAALPPSPHIEHVFKLADSCVNWHVLSKSLAGGPSLKTTIGQGEKGILVECHVIVLPPSFFLSFWPALIHSSLLSFALY